MHAADELGVIREIEREVLLLAQVLDIEVIRIESGAEIAADVKSLPGERSRTGP
ncbi:MAG TPA: hypothetical protein VGN85_11420 [Methyloceanibacter sp.]|nr:hypothetical protein [Methyloceanibacter sp.]